MPQSQARLAPAQIVFAPAQKTVTFVDVPGFALESVVMITNAASGKVIYDPEDESGALGGTVSGTVLTLAYDTTAMAATDQLRVLYNDLTREDMLMRFTPTGTGFFARIPVASYLQAILQMPVSPNTQIQVYGSIDGDSARAIQIRGILPDLPSNPGDVNNTSGGSFNLRYHEIAAFRFIHLNCTNFTAGSTPVILLALKTTPPPHHLGYVVGGNIGVSFDSGAPIGYVRTTSLFPEVVRGTLQSGAAVSGGTLSGGVLSANAVVTGGSRQANGQPNPFFSRYGVQVISDQSGTIQIQASIDGTNWFNVSLPVAVTGGQPLDLEVKVRANFYRPVYTNGGTATAANALSILGAFCGA